MIQDTVKVHDKYQFEIKLGYPFKKNTKFTTYDVETYFFFPKSLDMNKFTYTKQQFYNDVSANVRFKSPSVKLANILVGKTSPFVRLQNALEHCAHEKITVDECIYQIKLFSCIVRSAIRDHIVAIKKERLELDEGVKTFSTYVAQITKEYRGLKIPKVVADNYYYADEYMSILAEHYSHKLLTIIGGLKAKKSHIQQVSKIALAENAYREKKGYKSVAKEDSSNEKVVYRQSVLKKYMNDVLFLNTKTKQEGVLLEQIMFSVAAGIAMIFATGIAFASQLMYGNFTMSFFIALVIGYMFKDRIKDFFRIYFKGKLQRYLFDYKSLIYSNPKDIIGVINETVGFMKEKRVEAEIKECRDLDHITNLENEGQEESILKYHKKIRIFRNKVDSMYKYYNISALNDIMRFNVSHFLRRMDNPRKTLYTCNEKECKKVAGRRVYHVNLVIKYSNDEDEKFKHYRLVLNRDGIIRVERANKK